MNQEFIYKIEKNVTVEYLQEAYNIDLSGAVDINSYTNELIILNYSIESDYFGRKGVWQAINIDLIDAYTKETLVYNFSSCIVVEHSGYFYILRNSLELGWEAEQSILDVNEDWLTARVDALILNKAKIEVLCKSVDLGEYNDYGDAYALVVGNLEIYCDGNNAQNSTVINYISTTIQDLQDYICASDELILCSVQSQDLESYMLINNFVLIGECKVFVLGHKKCNEELCLLIPSIGMLKLKGKDITFTTDKKTNNILLSIV